MNILFVTPYPPSRIRTRTFGFISQLSFHHKVTVLCLCIGETDRGTFAELNQQGVAIHSVYEPKWLAYLRCFTTLWGKLPLQVAYGDSSRMRRMLHSLLTQYHFDLIHVEFIRALAIIPDQSPLPIIWDAVDCISQLYQSGARHGTTAILRAIGYREAQLTRTYERQQLYRFEHILVTSPRDQQALLQLCTHPDPSSQPHGQLHVLPHGINQGYFQPYKGVRQANTIVFSGKMSFHANIAAVLHLTKNIMPLIWQHKPDVLLIIAGSNPPPIIKRLNHHPRIIVTGYMIDLRPPIAQAQVSVCPLPYAVGVQNKVLEAMALGTPVVASSHAMAGLRASSGQDILVADDPDTFATSVLRLLDDQSLWKQLHLSGLAYIQKYHNWEPIIDSLISIYQQAVSKEASKGQR